MVAFPGLAARIQRVFRGQASTLIHRQVSALTARAAGDAAAGAETITLDTLSAGLFGILPGDTFGAGVYTFASDVPAAGGSIVDAPFGPGLSAGIVAGAAVNIVRTTITECQGWVEYIDASSDLATGVRQGDVRITLLADSLASEIEDADAGGGDLLGDASGDVVISPGFVPIVGGRIIEDTRAWTIVNVGRDPAGAGWTLLARS